MIASLTGALVAKAPGHCLIEVGGVGFKLLMSANSLSSLPSIGDVVTVSTYLHVREDELTLFGFESDAEKNAFEHLITVSGAGPKVALSALSALSPADLAAAVEHEDVAAITNVPGIGKKTAQRIIIELDGKLAGGAHSQGIPGSVVGDAVMEATDALLAMGFSAAEAASAVKGAEGPVASDATSLIRYALQRLGGATSGRGR